MAPQAIPDKYRIWIETRKKFHLSHKQIQMARELGLNPKKFGSLANHKQEPWKSPLPEFIEEIYFKRFRKNQPDRIESIEDMVKRQKKKKVERRELKTTAKNGNEKQEKEELPVPSSTLQIPQYHS